ncbi:MAG: hypothetical protein R3A46_00480 [Thermomicrobiales bacterium]
MTGTVQKSISELVSIARENYGDLPPIPLDDSITPEQFYAATPNRLAYAYGWIIALAIIEDRFLKTAVDVLPVFHPEHGWDRFLITRRVSGAAFQYQPANEFGMLMLDGEDAPRYTSPGGNLRVATGPNLETDADGTIAAILKHIKAPALGKNSDNRLREYEEAPLYPRFLRAVVELIVENPGLTAAREIYIDDEEIDGQYHPLYLHAAELSSMGPDDRHGANVATTTYRWFQLQQGELFAFFDKRGNRSVYRTDRGTWSRLKKQLADEESVEAVKDRLKGWLRIDGREPDPAVD